MEDPYKIIGVPRDADMDTVKQAYKKLVLKWHPDRNQDNPEAQTKIREINAAYDAIKNGSAKQADPFAQGFPGGFSNMHDMFRDFENMFGNGGFQRRVRNVQVQYNLTLEEAFQGKEAEITFKTPDGQVKTVKVKLPPGLDDGDSLRCAGQGFSLGPGLPVSDLIILIGVRQHPKFVRRGPNLITLVELDVFEAMTGLETTLQSIDGQTVNISIPAGVQPNSVLQSKGYGMNINGIRGDLMIQVKVNVPALNQIQIDKVKEFKNQL